MKQISGGIEYEFKKIDKTGFSIDETDNSATNCISPALVLREIF
jgi:hypothetical protein